MKSKFIIPIKTLDVKEEFKFLDIRPEELMLNIALVREFKKIDALITTRRLTLHIQTHFTVDFTAKLICVRCLEPFVQQFNAELGLSYVPGKDPYLSVENVNLKKTDINKVYFNGIDIDLRIGIREAIVLSMPIAPLCKKDCAGLCAICGKNKNKVLCDCPVERVGVFTPIKSEFKKQQRRKK